MTITIAGDTVDARSTSSDAAGIGSGSDSAFDASGAQLASAPSEAGTYTVRATLAENPYYSAATAEESFTIEPAATAVELRGHRIGDVRRRIMDRCRGVGPVRHVRRRHGRARRR